MDQSKELANFLYENRYEGKIFFYRKKEIIGFVDQLIDLIYPIRLEEGIDSKRVLSRTVKDLEIFLFRYLSDLCKNQSKPCDADEKTEEFFILLEKVVEKLDKDADYITENDPAARGRDEVILCYPGFYATAIYRIANCFHELEIPIVPRILSEYAHERTGVDIHPASKIGCPFYLDHATGTVIGETAVVGDYVKMYQGVTLGAVSVDKDMKGVKRHPDIGNNCVLYANCTILGGETIVGENSVIGGNVWLTKSVDEGSKIFK